MQSFLLTPESITALVQVLLAVLIAGYIFSRRNRSPILQLLGWSLVGETLHHFIKLVAFSAPSLFQSATPLLGVSSLFIFVILVVFAYEFRGRLFPKEGFIVSRLLGAIALLMSVLLFYVFFSAKPHDHISGSIILLYGSLTFLILSASWAIVVLLRKAYHFQHVGQDLITDPGNRTGNLQDSRQACIAFALVFSLKIFIIFASFLSAVGVVPVGVRIYVNLILHILYLSALTVVIIDYIQHPTSLQVKLIGLTLVSVLLILSIAGLSVFSTRSLLDQSKQVLAQGESILFTPVEQDAYRLAPSAPQLAIDIDTVLFFQDQENIQIDLGFPFPFGERNFDMAHVNRNGLVSFGAPYRLAAAPVFYMDQLSPPYRSKLHFGAYRDEPFIAPLLIRTVESNDTQLRIHRTPEIIAMQWVNQVAASEDQPENALDDGLIELRLFADGRIAFSYELHELYLHEGLIGLYPGRYAEVLYVDPQQNNRLALTARKAYIFDLGYTFRAFVHGEVIRLVWLIFGSIAFIILLFPLALRTSLFNPLHALLAGAQRIDSGRLDDPVPVSGADEIGDVTRGFNAMMESLRKAHEQLVLHAAHLEEEVTFRTEEIRQQKKVLEEQANRLRELDEMKSRFFANISHEFRTPLNLITGPLQNILDGQYGQLDGRLTQRHESMLLESKRLLRLINQMLDLSKLEAGRMVLERVPIDLVAFLQRIVHSFASRAEMEQKTLTFNSESDQVVALIDPQRFEDIGYNLIDNALKFTERGGKIRVSLTRKNEKFGIITFQDTGHGIAAEDIEIIFDRFQQVNKHPHNEPGGTGIGLALVQELVFLHDGTINVESEPGFGSTFTILLPLTEDQNTLVPGKTVTQDLRDNGRRPHTSSNAGSILDEKPALQKVTLLVVDDDAAFRQFVMECLDDSYHFREAEDGAAGLAEARSHTPDLIISDLMMPEMDGIAFCQSIKHDPDLDHIPFILLTAKTSVEHRIEGLTHGADAYLDKPIDPRELRSQVNNLLEQRRRLIEKYVDLVRLEPANITIASADATLLKRIREVIDQNMSDANFSVALLADELGMSTRDLQRKLKKLLNIGPKELMTSLRIERAKQLLAAQAGTVSQIAYKVGYSRPEHFMRTFKQHTGKTPGQFKKEAE